MKSITHHSLDNTLIQDMVHICPVVAVFFLDNDTITHEAFMCGMVSLVFLTGYLSMWTPTNLNNQTPKGVLTVLDLGM